MITENVYIYIVIYCIISLLVAVETANRGWKAINVFFVCILASPLIGAILYSPYKKDEIEPIESKETRDSVMNVEDPALTNLIASLENKKVNP